MFCFFFFCECHQVFKSKLYDPLRSRRTCCRFAVLQGQGGPVQTPTLNVTVPYLMVTFGNFQSELYQKCPGPPLSSLLQKMMLGPQFSLNSANGARHEDFVQMV